MSSTIAVEKLRVGMFIQLEGGWLSHPFPLSSFRIVGEDQIAALRRLGLRELRWVPERSLLSDSDSGSSPVAAAATPEKKASATLPAQQRRLDLQTQRELIQHCERQHADAAKSWREAFDGVAASPEEAARGAQSLTQAMLDNMLEAQEIGVRLVAGGGDRAAAHALNVGIISLLIARTLGLPPNELLDLGVGALLHDVGKTEVADRFRHAEEGFSSNEMNAYRDHVDKGLVLGRRMGLSAAALSVLAQHHEHADGSGFPLHRGGESLSRGARIVALVNRYDNLCNPQARTLSLTPHEAISVLFSQGRQRFDAVVLNAFIRMMGVYPAGSLVQLTDDRFGLVVGVNSSRPLKPRVLVYEPKLPRSEALVMDLERTSNLGIRRSLPANKLPTAAIDFLDPRPRVTYYFEPLLSPEPGEESGR